MNSCVQLKSPLILVTIHRRENHGERLDTIIKAIIELSRRYVDHQFVIPVHPNPNVKEKIHTELSGISNIILMESLVYPELVFLMRMAKLILTDSGGIQEEAPSFGVPVLVARYETERIEGVEKGFSKLVGADFNRICSEASLILDQDKVDTRLGGEVNPYGDGLASKRIVKIIRKYFHDGF